MNDPFADEELRRIADAGLLRRLRTLDSPQGPLVRMGDRELINFSSNDYLGLSQEPALREAMIEGVARFGTGAGASRLVCGNLAPHDELEAVLAGFKGSEAALAFSSGYAAAMGTIPALCGRDDTVILDKLSHGSLIDAARLSGATLRVFPHNDLDRLAHLLAGARAKSAAARVLVVTESIFSMDGDAAPLREIADLCDAQGALLLVDEAHAVGVCGPQGRGLIAKFGLEKRVALQMGTLSKAIGVSGGYVAASRALVDLLVNKARSLIYSTAPPPAVALAAARSVGLVQGSRGDELRAKLEANLRLLRERAWGGRESSLPVAAILPLILGDEARAMGASASLLERGHLIPAIRYPTVARGAARLRLTLSAAHEPGQIESLVACLLDLVPQLGSSADPAAEEGGDAARG